VHHPMLAPVMALILWSLAMLVWMLAARIPALGKAGIDLKTVRGGRPGALDGVLPDRTQWKAHNYIHLMEQPTLFYATCLALAVAGASGTAELTLAWAYVVLRVGHSLVQATANIVRYRFYLFAASTLVLGALAIRAMLLVA